MTQNIEEKATGLTPEQQELMQKLYEAAFGLVNYEELSANLNECLTQALQTTEFDDTKTRTNVCYTFDKVHQILHIINVGANPETFNNCVPHFKLAV